MNPVVSSATTATMTFFTASSAIVQFLITRVDFWPYVIWYAFWGFISGFIGRKGLKAVLKRTGKTALVILALALVLSGAFLMMGFISIEAMVSELGDGVKTGSACD